jgi:DNA replication protein DnaC
MLRECYIDEVQRRGLPFADDQETAAHINSAARWLVNRNCRPGLILFGSVGNGKTTLARAIVRLIGLVYDSAVSSERKGVAVFSAMEFATIAKEDPGRFEAIKKAELLFIDDVGVEPSVVKVWGNEVSPFVDAIYYRYDRQLFTIMTSNLDTDDMTKKYGLRVADRFTEMFDRIPFENHSYRK